MTFSAGRRALASHPRAVLAVLLALAIELVPAPSALVRHRHAGGETVHVHVGRVDGAAFVDDGAGKTLPGPGLSHATPSDLHAHLAPPAVVAALPAIVPPAPVLVGAPMPVARPAAEIPAAARPSQARAPPAAA